MNDRPHAGDPPFPEADVDPGDPIRDLAALEETPTAGFIQRLVGRIDRRLLGVDMIELGRSSVREVFLEYWNLFVSLFKDGKQDEGGIDRER